MKKQKQPSRPSSAQPGRAPAPLDRWVPPVNGGSLPRALSLSLSLPSGVGLSAPVSFARAPLSPSIGVWDPTTHPGLPLEVLLGRTVLLTVAR
jgi:hypothetical protein